MQFTGERYIDGESGVQLALEHWNRYLLAAQLCKSKTVLDIACGTGYGAHLIAQSAKHVLGVDIDSESVSVAQRQYKGPTLDFRTGSCTSIPCPDESFDRIVSFETLEHLSAQDQHTFIQEADRILKPKGLLIISTPDKDNYRNDATPNHFHLHELTPEEFDGLLKQTFPYVCIARQKTLTADLISSSFETSKTTIRSLKHNDDSGSSISSALPTAEYAIAIAGRQHTPKLKTSVMLDTDDIIATGNRAAWQQEIERISSDYQKEIQRIGEERDQMLADKDRDWQHEVQRVAGDYQKKMERVAREKDTTIALLNNALPTVSLIVVNQNGEKHLNSLLKSIKAQNYPHFELIFVDNASTDNSVAKVKTLYPEARIVTLKRNEGFTGGVNSGFKLARGDYIALLNNDTTVDPLWLMHLVAELSDPQVGAAGPLIHFAESFVELKISSSTFIPSEKGIGADSRTLGILLDADCGFEEVDYQKPLFCDGFCEPETLDGRRVVWTNGNATLCIPVKDTETLHLKLKVRTSDVLDESEFIIAMNGCAVYKHKVSAEWQELRIPLYRHHFEGEARKVINNAGSNVDKYGKCSDRGIFEPDHGQYAKAEDVSALCGCAMLIKRAALPRDHIFESAYFAYFEDADLCWSMRKLGWRLRFTPHSLVSHHHAATSNEGSAFFQYYVHRNQRILITRHGPYSSVLALITRDLLQLVRLLPNALLKPNTSHAITLKAKLSFLILALGILSARIATRIRSILTKRKSSAPIRTQHHAHRNI